ncbi:unnamed protein product [Adineta steineri]|uniref:Uncharacterized protein n=1 Tax=Adineta steineri TaxID=433720 RepID=A0A814QJS8_9BILA|nr:unnamed protein product [Adineta steineri]CAF1119414.1 unnamed protein product [Adineta steineri]
MERQHTLREFYNLFVDKRQQSDIFRFVMETANLPNYDPNMPDGQGYSDLLLTNNYGESGMSPVFRAYFSLLLKNMSSKNYLDRNILDKYRTCELCNTGVCYRTSSCSNYCCILAGPSPLSAGCPGNQPNATPKGCCKGCWLY